jgi:hypothetical protein
MEPKRIGAIDATFESRRIDKSTICILGTLGVASGNGSHYRGSGCHDDTVATARGMREKRQAGSMLLILAEYNSIWTGGR